jgi:hypothetical protein
MCKPDSQASMLTTPAAPVPSLDQGLIRQAATPASLKVLAALASPPATKAHDPDPFPCRSLRHAIYSALSHFGLETACFGLPGSWLAKS